ncbi:DUF6308 family protein [Streptomyces sp. NBC_00210]|uniref:DUF6308 family protein n=1 Tax=unclassified Streptomyces TaxID=2593676 RepID=UPI0032549E9F
MTASTTSWSPRRWTARAPLAHRLNSLITSDQAVSDLRCYFGTGLLDEAVPFTGSRFEHLAGGGDCQAVANVVTADDLIAVQTLSVRIPAQVAVELLEGDLGVRLSAAKQRSLRRRHGRDRTPASEQVTVPASGIPPPGRFCDHFGGQGGQLSV